MDDENPGGLGEQEEIFRPSSHTLCFPRLSCLQPYSMAQDQLNTGLGGSRLTLKSRTRQAGGGGEGGRCWRGLLQPQSQRNLWLVCSTG